MPSAPAVLVLLAVVWAPVACLAPPPIERPPAEARRAMNEVMLERILTLGQDGDWLVIRGYHDTDQLVTTATNTPLSHAAVLDHGRREVIEAEAKGVHLSALERFVDKAHRLLLIRPIWAQQHEGAGRHALAVARKLVGSPYDFLGTVGLDHPHAFYCSELAVYVYKHWITPQDELPQVMEPGQMYLWGTILYDSRPRR